MEDKEDEIIDKLHKLCKKNNWCLFSQCSKDCKHYLTYHKEIAKRYRLLDKIQYWYYTRKLKGYY